MSSPLTPEEMLNTLVCSQLDDIQAMALNGDTLVLARWLGPLLKQHIMSELDITELDSDEAFIAVDTRYAATFACELQEPDDE